MPENPYSSQPNVLQFRAYEPMDDEISLLGFVVTITKHKKLILGFWLSPSLVDLETLFIPTNVYTAKTQILPVGRMAVSMELYVSLLKSRPVADSLAKRLKQQALRYFFR